jgi:site-specific DNA recombinase
MVGSDTPENFLMEHLIVGMAEFYSRNLSREIMKGLKQRALEGHLVFRPPFGYQKEVIEKQEGHKRTRIISRPVVDQKTAPVVQRIFKLYDEGMGYKSIAMTLNSEGFRTNQVSSFGCCLSHAHSETGPISASSTTIYTKAEAPENRS